ncbi:TolC family outer membrane protein [Candidatus Methylopumilus turicensis]|uniref:Type I secretion outer membrane protein, TolC family n=1 Tax=Candidatus Methylopumilus turicensis TaxID=1581680 RepID=A0A0B7J042_9PROT|nr:TolC family outer membrane protein [Candidatus Methylopumilus turicensis]CEN56710.1 Type I secretion outer membrane protein, TolC family [Candidatus Methylopumilus turicensis]
MRLNYLFLLLGLALGHHAQAADSQNLMQIYQQALSRDPVWASAQSSHLASQEKLAQGNALFLPTVTFNSGVSATQSDAKFFGGATSVLRGGQNNFESYNYGVNVSQPIYRKQIRAQFEQAKSQVAQADKQLLLAKQGLIIRSSKAYFDVLLAQDKIDLIGAQKTAINKQLEQAKANFEVGTSTITDFNEAQARFDLVVAQEIAAMNDLEVKKRAIQAIVGSTPQALVGVRSDLVAQSPEPIEMEKWVEVAEQNNLTIALQQQALEIATQEVERQNAGHMPTLDAVAGYNNNYANGTATGLGNGSDITSASIGLQLQIPLYQGGLVSSKVREAVANKQKALDDLEAAKRQADLDTRSAYLNLSSSVAQIKAYEQALSSSQSQLDSTNLGYEVGVRTSVDVLNAQQQYFSAKRDLLQSRYTYLVNILSLKSAVGLLGETDVESVNQQLVSR